jgi:hypothetical protein
MTTSFADGRPTLQVVVAAVEAHALPGGASAGRVSATSGAPQAVLGQAAGSDAARIRRFSTACQSASETMRSSGASCCSHSPGGAATLSFPAA